MIWINGTVTLLDEDESSRPTECRAADVVTNEPETRKSSWIALTTGVRGVVSHSWFAQRPVRDLPGPLSR
jgi:hypothetical protein